MPKQTTNNHCIILKLEGVNIFSVIVGKAHNRQAPTTSPIPDQNNSGLKETSPHFLGIMFAIPPLMENRSDNATPIQYGFSTKLLDESILFCVFNVPLLTIPMLFLPNMNEGFNANNIPPNKLKQGKVFITVNWVSIHIYANTRVKIIWKTTI